jgi:hypothetical protein
MSTIATVKVSTAYIGNKPSCIFGVAQGSIAAAAEDLQAHH